MMPLDHENATATVSITGLALGCYNKATQNYEVGFLRHKTHNLTIEVTKHDAAGESRMIYQIEDARHRIFIDAENAVAPADPIYIVTPPAPPDKLDRNDDSHDQEDFRWVIDFELELNGEEEVNLKPPDVPVTEMYISKPRLYADKDMMKVDPFLLVNIDPATKQPVVGEIPREFGLFTEGIKADITCQAGGAVILRVDGPQGFQVQLPHGAPKPHQITIKNDCPPKVKDENGGGQPGGTTTDPDKFEATDFSLYYSLIVDTDGKKFDLKFTGDDRGEGAVCNGSTLGKRDSLFPLPGSGG